MKQTTVPVGILNMYKEKDWTSFDVVAKLRGILQIKKLGHTGTLDPQAEGVLPICVGRATKVVDLMTDLDKTYQATCTLGQATDTQDHTGTVIHEAPVAVDAETVVQALMAFVGEGMQVPPMYSAVKVGGIKLYELARAGEVVERDARPMAIRSITNVLVDLPHIHFTVTCSKGTYIRTLCHDLGLMLGTYGHMNGLVRTQVGPFDVAKSLTLEQLRAALEQGDLNQLLLPVDTLFTQYEALHLKASDQGLIDNGTPIPYEVGADMPDFLETLFRVYDENNRFIGLYQGQFKHHHYRLKVLKRFI